MTVTPLRPGTTQSETKQKFLDYFAQKFDSMTEHSGEPVAVLFCFCNAEAAAAASYMTNDEGPLVSLYVARMAQVVQCDALNWIDR